MSMNVPPPDPSSAAAQVEMAAGEAVTDVVGEAHPLAAPLDNRAERRQARRERIRLLLRRPAFLAGSLVLLFWIVCAILGDRITPFDPINEFGTVSSFPSSEHWLGTDQLGRDVLSRIMAGSRDVLVAAPIAAIIGVAAGTLLGLVMGYYRGWVDEVIGRVVEALLSIPVILVAVLILATLGSSRFVVVMTVAVLFTPIVTRTIRAAVLAESQLDYVTSSRLRGESGPYIMTREILPNLSGTIVVELTVRIGYAVFTIATLSFLGVGIQPPSPDWGLQIASTYGLIQSGQWWMTLFPGLAIASLVIATNLVADSVEAVIAT